MPAAAPPVPAAEAVRRFAAGKVPPVVVFAGEERFLAEEGIAAVSKALFADGEPAGASTHLDGASLADQDRIAAAVEELMTPSLFGAGKLVVVRNAEAIGGRAATADGEDDEEGDEVAGESVAKQPAAKGPRKPSPITTLVKQAASAAVPGAVLVLATRKPVKGKSSVSADAITKTGALLVDCRRLYDTVPPWARGQASFDTEVARWVKDRAQAKHGKAMDARAAFGLSLRAGGGLSALARALETLAAYVGTRPAILESDVAAVVADAREDPAWRLADAILEGDLNRSIEMASAAFERGVPDGKGRSVSRPESVFAMLFASVHSSWRRAMLVCEARARGEDLSQVPALAGLPSFVVERVARQAAKRTPDDLLARHRAFVEAEAGVKGDGVPPRLAFERMVVALSR